MNAQRIAANIGENGCYFISLLRLVNAEYGAIRVYKQALSLGIIAEDCYVENPPRLMELVAGGKWSVEHKPADYQTKPNEFEILRFERKTTTKTFAHFVVGDGQGNVEYDPLDDSNTVKYGELVSKRIVRRI